jgi:hypothetical protein
MVSSLFLACKEQKLESALGRRVVNGSESARFRNFALTLVALCTVPVHAHATCTCLPSGVQLTRIHGVYNGN